MNRSIYTVPAGTMVRVFGPNGSTIEKTTKEFRSEHAAIVSPTSLEFRFKNGIRMLVQACRVHRIQAVTTPVCLDAVSDHIAEAQFPSAFTNFSN